MPVAEIVDWEVRREDDGGKGPLLRGLTREDIARKPVVDIKRIGRIDQETLEGMMVGILIGDPDEPNQDKRPADKMSSAGIDSGWFEDKVLGGMFDEFLDYYRRQGRLLTPENFSEWRRNDGLTQDEVAHWRHQAQQCHAAYICHTVDPEALIRRFINTRRRKLVEKSYRKYLREYDDPKVGPQKATEAFRLACTIDLADPEGAPIKETDWQKDYDGTVSWLKDMKANPDKYRGLRCGINAIDDKTNGFTRGHLTTFVGFIGGYKTTMMINVAHRLWLKGCNVLFVSLEMPARELMAKLWCISTGKVSMQRILRGMATAPEDWDELARIEAMLSDPKLPDAEKSALKAKYDILHNNTSQSVDKDKNDFALIRQAYEEFKDKKNQLVILNCGLLGKLTPAKLQGWLKERQSLFRPDVVIVDYLACMQPDVPSDRHDIDMGEICKSLRNMGYEMGFSTITAAQYKKQVYDRLRHSNNSPDKMQFQLDDIAESAYVGNDSDTVFMLYAGDGGNQLWVFTPKARHGEVDRKGGKVLQVDPFTCTISSDMEDTSARAATVDNKTIMSSLGKISSGKDKDLTSPDSPGDLDIFFGGVPASHEEGQANQVIKDDEL